MFVCHTNSSLCSELPGFYHTKVHNVASSRLVSCPVCSRELDNGIDKDGLGLGIGIRALLSMERATNLFTASV